MQCKNSKNFLVLSVAQGNAVALLYSDWGYKLPVWRKRATINLYYERTFWCILISVSSHSYDFIIVVINSWLCEITSSMVYNFVILFTLHAWYTTLLYFYLYARYNTLLCFYLYFFFSRRAYTIAVLLCSAATVCWQLSHTNCWKYFCSVTDPCYERTCLCILISVSSHSMVLLLA